MARVNIEEIVSHLDIDIRRALEETIKHHFPDATFDKRAVFRTFVRMVRRKCSTWETVPDHYVDSSR